jgi:hypothetical protein
MTFTLFSNLPTELRLQIWNHAIADLEPRFVCREPKAKGNYTPSILHANSEARAEGRKRYERGGSDATDTCGLAGIFLDYDSDIITTNYRAPWSLTELLNNNQFVTCYLLSYGSKFNRHKIQRLAFPVED